MRDRVDGHNQDRISRDAVFYLKKELIIKWLRLLKKFRLIGIDGDN